MTCTPNHIAELEAEIEAKRQAEAEDDYYAEAEAAFIRRFGAGIL